MTQRHFGTTAQGAAVDAFTLVGAGGTTAEFIELGASLTSLKVLVDGTSREVVLGCDDLAGYEGQEAYLGAVVGRCANRTAGGQLHLDGVVHQLDLNHGPHHLHGGAMGLSSQVWAGEFREDARGPSVRFVCTSPAGQGGYPGALQVSVDYTLDADSRLWMEFSAVTDAPTAVNLTNHAYFNLGGEGCLDCKGHTVQVLSERWMETDDERIPTGQLLSVEGTPLDLREPQRLEEVFAEVHPVLEDCGGYDHTLVVEDRGPGVHEVARVTSPDDRLQMRVWTDQPSLQLYTGNFMAGTPARGGGSYGGHAGLCLEAQGLPDATKHPGFPSTVLRPGEVYRHCTVYGFRPPHRDLESSSGDGEAQC